MQAARYPYRGNDVRDREARSLSKAHYDQTTIRPTLRVTSEITIELRSRREDLSRLRPVSSTQGRAINNEASRRIVTFNT